MKETTLTLPRLIAIAVTRGLLGAGIGMLVATKIPMDRRVPLGIALATIGALSTFPLILPVARKLRMADGDSRRGRSASAHGVWTD